MKLSNIRWGIYCVLYMICIFSLYMFDCTIQLHQFYFSGDLFSFLMNKSGIFAMYFIIGYAVITGISMIASKFGEKSSSNLNFYPSLKGLRTVIRWGVYCVIYMIFIFLLYMLDYIITQPHPFYFSGNCFNFSMNKSEIYAMRFTIGYAVITGISMIASKFGEKSSSNLNFYPSLKGLRTAVKKLIPRLILITGFIISAGYLTYTYIEFYKLNLRPHGLLCPPNYLFTVFLFLWCTLWICDASRKENRGSLPAALLCTTWNVYLLSTLFIARGFLIE